ncbi:hypothetical protein TCAL_15293 [Tigriopus californicus]|uniref:Uncharacterized protein n=1 Tax=Tigriopus californicus TaxID=6832 RepID=A0A553PKB9_TIGCA|nr:adhesion G protein-coupled receptor E5-like [Tigriopus californicus]TRY78128.1 hypothetical protein TCAL_15293 [Tigriopus californicus]
MYIDTDETQCRSANYMLNTMLLRLGLTFASMVTGTYAEYDQNVMLYFIFTIINGILGGVIFFTHCSCNEKVRAILAGVKAKIFGNKHPNETETESLEGEDTIEESVEDGDHQVVDMNEPTDDLATDMADDDGMVSDE